MWKVVLQQFWSQSGCHMTRVRRLTHGKLAHGGSNQTSWRCLVSRAGTTTTNITLCHALMISKIYFVKFKQSSVEWRRGRN